MVNLVSEQNYKDMQEEVEVQLHAFLSSPLNGTKQLPSGFVVGRVPHVSLLAEGNVHLAKDVNYKGFVETNEPKEMSL
jgi:hypothetical protein